MHYGNGISMQGMFAAGLHFKVSVYNDSFPSKFSTYSM